MSTNIHKTGPGGHYSGANPIPNIQKFVESLDKEKRDRDRKIDEESKSHPVEGDNTTYNSEARDHKPSKPAGKAGSRKRVTDPVTGNEVEIEDVNADFLKSVGNPHVRTVLP